MDYAAWLRSGCPDPIRPPTGKRVDTSKSRILVEETRPMSKCSDYSSRNSPSIEGKSTDYEEMVHTSPIRSLINFERSHRNQGFSRSFTVRGWQGKFF